MTTIAAFAVGVFVGAVLGFIAAALCYAGRDES